MQYQRDFYNRISQYRRYRIPTKYGECIWLIDWHGNGLLHVFAYDKKAINVVIRHFYNFSSLVGMVQYEYYEDVDFSKYPIHKEYTNEQIAKLSKPLAKELEDATLPIFARAFGCFTGGISGTL